MTDRQTIGKGKPGPGRKKGVPNKTTGLLKSAIVEAATLSGGHEGLVGFLMDAAKNQPVAFLGLLGRVVPLQHSSDEDSPVVVEVRRVIVDAATQPPGTAIKKSGTSED